MSAKIDLIKMDNDIQIIGIDVGRGYLKAYTVYNNKPQECMFKSITALGRNMDTSKYSDPIYIQYNNVDYFIGELAEIEGDNPIHNLRDEKTSQTVSTLIAATLSQLASTDNVKIVLGVPNKLFTKTNRDTIKEFYKGKRYTVKDKLTNSFKKVTIDDIEIFREADAALVWHTKDMDSLDRPIAIASVGFRTTEFSYFDKNFRFNDKLSKTKELGNKTALEFIERKLAENNIMRNTFEIDSSDEYNELKEVAYGMLNESVINEIENIWPNTDEITIKMGGGTVLHFKESVYEVIPESQMATAKGLFYVGEELF